MADDARLDEIVYQMQQGTPKSLRDVLTPAEMEDKEVPAAHRHGAVLLLEV